MMIRDVAGIAKMILRSSNVDAQFSGESHTQCPIRATLRAVLTRSKRIRSTSRDYRHDRDWLRLAFEIRGNLLT